jgi:drug/metabolite transporter (DMT)-like permease
VLMVTTSPFESGLLVLLAAVAGGVACGLTILRRVEESRHWGTLVIIGLVVVGIGLLVGVPSFVGHVGIGGAISIGGLSLIGFASPLIEVGIAALALYMAAARKLSVTTGQGPQSA